jgi:hypothetical protein
VGNLPLIVFADEDDGQFVPLMAFECRGIEPTAFHPEVRVYQLCAAAVAIDR